MPQLVNGDLLNRYVAPALINDIRNTEDNFTQFLGKVNKGAVTAEGVAIQKLINVVPVHVGLDENDTVSKQRLATKNGVIPWLNFTTDALEFTHEELRAIMYDKEGEGRKILKSSILNAILAATLHAVAPENDSARTPLVGTTGADDGSGRNMLRPKDIISFLRKTDIKDPVCVLSKAHLLDMQEYEESKSRFNQILINQQTVTPVAYGGINFIANDIAIRYTPAGNKRAIDAAPVSTDRFASVFIDKANTLFYLNNLMFITQDMKNDMVNSIPRSSFRIFGQFMGVTVEQDRFRGAIIDSRGLVPAVEPLISELSPITGAVGSSVVIEGSGFTGTTEVNFGATAATSFTVDSDTQITAVVPSVAGSTIVTVVTPVGTSNGSGFTISNDEPVITELTPITGAAASSVVIEGSGFTGATEVNFGATAATSFTVDSDTQITAVVPAGVGAKSVTVVTPVGTSNGSGFTISE